MNPRFTKEFRPLLLPWSIAVCAGLVGPLLIHLVRIRVLHTGEFLSFVYALASFAFFACLLAIAAIPFGAEIQQGTLPLLMSQPFPRLQWWRNKFLTSVCGIATAIAVQAAAYVILLDAHFLTTAVESREQLAILCLFILPTLSSVGFWTLIGRSTLAGMVFTATAQLFVVGILSFIVERFGISSAGQIGIFVASGLVYSGFFFWLTWRKILNLEARQLVSEAKASAESLTAGGWRLDWLRCRSTSGFLNLIRKEIQLQRLIFIIAAILSASWLLAYVLTAMQPSRTTFAEIVFSLTLGAYIPLTALLAGCISLSEEKNLGLMTWELTLPISIRRQWAVKLAVGVAVWLLFGLVLPYVLTWLGLAVNSTRLLKDADAEFWLMVFAAGSGLFVASFWAMTLAVSVIRAVLAGILILVALSGAVAFGIWVAASLLGDMVLQSLSSPSFVCLLVISPMLIVLAQSLSQFRNLQSNRRVALERFGISVALTFFVVFGYFLLICILGLRVGEFT